MWGYEITVGYGFIEADNGDALFDTKNDALMDAINYLKMRIEEDPKATIETPVVITPFKIKED